MAMLFNSDPDPALRRRRELAAPDSGARGAVHALKLRDPGVDLFVGLRPGSVDLAACEHAWKGVTHDVG